MESELVFYKSKNTALLEGEISSNISDLNLKLCDTSATNNRDELLKSLKTALSRSNIIFLVSGAFESEGNEHIIKLLSEILELPLSIGEKVALNDSILINNPESFHKNGTFIENKSQVICVLPDTPKILDEMMKNQVYNLISMKYDIYGDRDLDISNILGDDFSPDKHNRTIKQEPQYIPKKNIKSVILAFAIILLSLLLCFLLVYSAISSGVACIDENSDIVSGNNIYINIIKTLLIE